MAKSPSSRNGSSHAHDDGVIGGGTEGLNPNPSRPTSFSDYSPAIPTGHAIDLDPNAPAFIPRLFGSDSHGHSEAFHFRDLPSLDESLEEMLRRFPAFKRKSILLRSCVHYALEVLARKDMIGIPVDSMLDGMKQDTALLQSAKLLAEEISKYGQTLLFAEQTRDFRLIHDLMMRLARRINEGDITHGQWELYWRMMDDDPTLQRLVKVMEEKGFSMEYWKRMTPEFM